MISCDTNVLYAASNPDDPNHERALELLGEHANDLSFVIAEQTLIELYGLLRNPTIQKRPLTAAEAVAVVRGYRGNPVWSVVDVPSDGVMMRELWRRAAMPGFARRRIHDLRLALTLKHWGVKTFYTRNTRDFTDVGFDDLVNPF